MLASPTLPHPGFSSKISAYISSFAIDSSRGVLFRSNWMQRPSLIGKRSWKISSLLLRVRDIGWWMRMGCDVFGCVLRSKDVNKNVTLNNNQDPKPPHELLLKKGNELLWAATSDVKLNVESNWQAYAIHQLFASILRRCLRSYGRLDPLNNFTLMDHNRIFFEGMSYRNGSGGRGANKVSGFRFQVSGFRFQVSGLKSEV